MPRKPVHAFVIAAAFTVSGGWAKAEELQFGQKNFSLDVFSEAVAKDILIQWVSNGAASRAIAVVTQTIRSYINQYGSENGGSISGQAQQAWQYNLEGVPGVELHYTGHSWTTVSAQSTNGMQHAGYIEQLDQVGASLKLPFASDPRASSTFDTIDYAIFGLWFTGAWEIDNAAGLISVVLSAAADFSITDAQGIYDTTGSICVTGPTCMISNTLNGAIALESIETTFSMSALAVPAPDAGLALAWLPGIWLLRRRRAPHA